MSEKVCHVCSVASTSNPSEMSAAALNEGAWSEIIGVKLCSKHAMAGELAEALENLKWLIERIDKTERRDYSDCKVFENATETLARYRALKEKP